MTTIVATLPPPPAASGPSTRRSASQSPSRPVRSPSSARASPRSVERNVSMSKSSGDGSGAQPAGQLPSTASAEPGSRFLQPSSFYPLNNQHAGPFDNSLDPVTGQKYGAEGILLSPEDDKEAMRGIPIFSPTMDDFQDFEGYVTKTVAWGQYSGIVKIVPPPEWKQTLPPISKARLAETPIRAPIQQVFQGTNGLFSQRNIVRNKNRPIPVREWFEKCYKKEFVAPSPNDVDRARDRDSQVAKERRAAETSAIKQKRIDARAAKAKRDAKRAAEAVKEENAGETAAVADGEQGGQDAAEELQNLDEDAPPPLDPPSPHSSSEDPTAKTPEPDVPEWYQQFDPHSSWLPPKTTPTDYTPEACFHMERKFWKTLGLGEPGWYGADMEGSLFEDESTPWNVAHLPNLLNRMERSLPGVSNPYLYFGMWRAAFAWHVEDMDLFSINYIHFGAPKFWYAIPQASAEKFERTIAALFPLEAKACDQFLRHKAYNMSPSRLKADGIRVNQLVHNQGEFVITYPRGYHSGFNMGFNCAESVNFALESWLELGRKAKACQCFEWTVKIDVDELLGIKAKKQKEEEEKLAFQKKLIEHAQKEREKKATKRPADGQMAGPKRKRTKRVSELGDSSGSDTRLPVSAVHEPKQKAPESRPRPIVHRPVSYPCVLCPSTRPDNLLPVYEPDETVHSRNKAADHRIRAHEACANAVTETWIERKQVGEDVVDFAMGVNNIPRARWDLKCSVCENKALAKGGAKIQCTKGKCPKAFHVTCAIDHKDVDFRPLTRTVEVPMEGPDGPYVVRQVIVEPSLLCPSHNPLVIDRKKRQAREELARKIYGLRYGDAIKIKSGGIMEEVAFLASYPDTSRVQVVAANGQTKEVDWERIDWRPIQAQVVENDYAREYNSKPSRRREEDRSPTVRNDTAHDYTASIAGRPAPHSALIHHATLPQPRSAQFVQPSFRHPELHNTAPLASMYGPSAQPRHDTPVHNSLDRMLPPPVPSLYPHMASPLPAYQLKPIHVQPHVVQQSQPVWPHPVHQISDHLGHGAFLGQLGQQRADDRHHAYLSTPTPQKQAAVAVHPLRHTPATPPVVPPASAPNQQAPGSVVKPAGTVNSDDDTRNNDGIDLGLGRMLRIIKHLPPITIPAIHLAGTNGKGSVSAILEACLMAAGLSVGRYNSPHLVEPRDAVRIKGSPPSAADYQAAIDLVMRINQEGGINASPFEVTTAAVYHLLQSSQVDVMIIECGMGGARDATNVLNPAFVLAAGLTTVGLDHMTFLGDTVDEITLDKAQITPEGGLLVVGAQNYSQVAETATNVALAKSARVVMAPAPHHGAESPRTIDLDRVVGLNQLVRSIRIAIPDNTGTPHELESRLSLPGAHQEDNLSLALNILATLRMDRRALSIQPKLSYLPDEILTTAPARATWPGRCSWKSWRNSSTGQEHQILLDGAHNADSAKVLRHYIDHLQLESSATRPATFILSLSESRDKPIESVLDPLLVSGNRVALIDFTTPVEGMAWIKAASKDAMRQAASKIVAPEDVWTGEGSGPVALEKALQWATADQKPGQRGLIVVCGSLYLVADAYRLMGL